MIIVSEQEKKIEDDGLFKILLVSLSEALELSIEIILCSICPE